MADTLRGGAHRAERAVMNGMGSKAWERCQLTQTPRARPISLWSAEKPTRVCPLRRGLPSKMTSPSSWIIEQGHETIASTHAQIILFNNIHSLIHRFTLALNAKSSYLTKCYVSRCSHRSQSSSEPHTELSPGVTHVFSEPNGMLLYLAALTIHYLN